MSASQKDTGGARRWGAAAGDLAGNPLRVTLLLLTCAAGSVDGTSYQQLGQVFPANMTGNTVLLALRAGGADSGAVAGNLTALFGFCLGATLGALTHQEKHNPVLRKVTRTLVVELILMGTAALLWQFTYKSNELVLIGLLALAMGLQAAVAVRIAITGVSSVTITNTLASAFIWLVRPIRNEDGSSSRARSVPFLAGIWVAYFLGALESGLAGRYGLDLAFIFPTILLAAVVAVLVRANAADSVSKL